MHAPAEAAAHHQVTSEEIKAVAVAVGGLNEAARRLGLSPGTVRQRCRREGWMEDAGFRGALTTLEKKTGKTPATQHLPATLPATSTPAQAIAAEMRDLGTNSRLNMARGLSKAAEHVSTLDGKAIVEDASNIKQTVQSLDVVHGWKDQAPTAKVAIHITGNTPTHPEPITIEAEWSDDVGQEPVRMLGDGSGA